MDAQQQAYLRKAEIPFTMVANQIIFDSRISSKAKFYYVYLSSKPNDWKFHTNCIIKEIKEGRDAFYNGLKELIVFGYLERHQIKENGKFKHTDYILKIPHTENTDTIKSHTENTDYNNNDINKKDIKKNDLIKEKTNKKETPNSATHEENLTTQKQYEKDFEDFYEAFEGKHPSKQPKRVKAIYNKWKLAVKTHPPESIVKAVQGYAEYLCVATWRRKKDIIAWLNSAMYDIDWKKETLQEQQKSNQLTFNKQNAKPTLRETIDANRTAIRGVKIDDYF